MRLCRNSCAARCNSCRQTIHVRKDNSCAAGAIHSFRCCHAALPQFMSARTIHAVRQFMHRKVQFMRRKRNSFLSLLSCGFAAIHAPQGAIHAVRQFMSVRTIHAPQAQFIPFAAVMRLCRNSCPQGQFMPSGNSCPQGQFMRCRRNSFHLLPVRVVNWLRHELTLRIILSYSDYIITNIPKIEKRKPIQTREKIV